MILYNDMWKGEERVNMCQALEELYQDALEEGREEGRKSGRHEGIVLAKTIFRLSAQGKSEQEIAEETGVKPEEVREILG